MNTDQLEEAMELGLPEGYAQGVFPSDCLPPRPPRLPAAYVVNTDPSTRKGEHWVAIYFDECGRGEYFCSQAIEPTEHLLIFKFLSEGSDTSYSWTSFPIQGEDSQSCGAFALYWLFYRARGVPSVNILEDFSVENKTLNDCFVVDWVERNFDIDATCHELPEEVQGCISYKSPPA